MNEKQAKMTEYLFFNKAELQRVDTLTNLSPVTQVHP